MSTNVDLSKFKPDPTIKFMDNDVYIPLQKDVTKKVNIFVAPLTFAREESLFQFGQEDESMVL